MSDADARRAASDPSRNIILEASAGTGKTRVLVERYVNLLLAGVEPDHILAVTFTRKAAAEMRDRIIDRLREASHESLFDLARWRALKDRLGDIAISTIDAFCLSLLREFPLEADLDPGFQLADDTELPRLVAESLDQTLRTCRALARTSDDVALVFAQLGERRLRTGLSMLLDRRLVAPDVLRRYLQQGPRDLTPAAACQRAAGRLRDVFSDARDGLGSFLADGPVEHPRFAMLRADIERVCGGTEALPLDTREQQAAFRAFVDRLRAYFLTLDGRPRGKTFAGTGFTAGDCDSTAAWRRHRQTAASLAPAIAEAILGFRRDLNAILSRGVWQTFAIAGSEYERTLEARALLDFTGVLERAVRLLKGMDEFAQSRFRIEARYRHVLVDEFQDTSRAQWDLVSQLVRTWGEGLGAAADALPPSIFIVGDRKQSIYGFRDADVSVLDDAASFVERLRGDDSPRHAISVSFRAAPSLLSFLNDLFENVVGEGGAGGSIGSTGASGAPDTGAANHPASRRDRFLYGEPDRFPIDDTGSSIGREEEPSLGLIAGQTVRSCADQTAERVVGLLQGVMIRDRLSGERRPVTPSDVAILFRSRESHREFERALEERGILTYVYKGLGFFESDEVQDVVSLLRYLADPLSNMRAAAFLRSRIVRVSDAAIAQLAPSLALALVHETTPEGLASLNDDDRAVLVRVRAALPRWLAWVDRLRPTELLGAVLAETVYAYEMRGPGRSLARENLKKLRGMVARFENRGYATLARVADHLEDLAVGDESNAAIDATGAVSLMTIHAAKGLEFPVVFVVNLGRGTGGIRAPIRIGTALDGEPSVAIADYQSDADLDAQARDREETKRLLYVALTRARDRLYLSATVQDGVCRMGRGSLGEVLPAAVKSLFATVAEAPPGTGEATWVSPSGHVHRFAL